MKKLFAGALLAALASFGYALAQDALVVSVCGTPPITYTAGQTRLPTVDTTGKLCLSGGGGGGGTPGGISGQLQYNNAGSFGGVAGSAVVATGLTLGAIAPTTVNGNTFGGGPYTITGNSGATLDIGAGGTIGPFTIGTSAIASGTDKGLLYNNAGVAGNLATANSGVLVTSGAGVPSISSTLPSGITLVAPVLGTPASGVATNLTGTAASLTAGTVTTNANLTGDVTSVGNATTLVTTQTAVHTWSAAQTYSGAEINSTAGVASVAAKTFTGTILTGGTGTTNFPHIFVQPTGTTAATTWNTSGTIFGANAPTGWAGNFVDFRTNGAATVLFRVGPTGLVTANNDIVSGGGSVIASSAGALGWTGRGALTSTVTGTVQIGTADIDTNAASTAQILRVQGMLAGGTSNQSGKDFTFIMPPSKGTGTGGAFILQTSPAGSTGTALNAPVTAFKVDSAGLITVPLIASDAALTDTTVCQDTTNHGLRSGSGALGVCLGTSGRQFKTAFAPMVAGIDDLMKINFLNYRYKDGWGDNGVRMQYGTTAQDVEAAIPDIARQDANGNTINYDSGALLFVGLRAIQQLKADNDNLRAKIEMLERASHK